MDCIFPDCIGGQGGTICRPDCSIPSLRDAAQQALEALRTIETITSRDWLVASRAMRDLSAALERRPVRNTVQIESYGGSQ